MTIKNIDYTNDRIREKEEKEEKKEDSKEQKAYQELIKKFNEKANKLKILYKIGLQYKHPHLYKIKKHKFLFWNWEEEEEMAHIIYLEDYFVFYDGLSSKTFREIEEILNNIDIKFEVKLKSGKIPAKYKILEELK